MSQHVALASAKLCIPPFAEGEVESAFPSTDSGGSCLHLNQGNAEEMRVPVFWSQGEKCHVAFIRFSGPFLSGRATKTVKNSVSHKITILSGYLRRVYLNSCYPRYILIIPLCSIIQSVHSIITLLGKEKNERKIS